jgi:hypothetical protein
MQLEFQLPREAACYLWGSQLMRRRGKNSWGFHYPAE